MDYTAQISLPEVSHEDISTLSERLFLKFNVTTQNTLRFLFLKGSRESVDKALKYCNLMLKPETVHVKDLSSEAKALLIPKVLCILETQFKVAITIRDDGLIFIRGSKSDADKCKNALIILDQPSSKEIQFTQFKRELLSNLCQVYDIPFDELSKSCSFTTLLSFLNFLSAFEQENVVKKQDDIEKIQFQTQQQMNSELIYADKNTPKYGTVSNSFSKHSNSSERLTFKFQAEKDSNNSNKVLPLAYSSNTFASNKSSKSPSQYAKIASPYQNSYTNKNNRTSASYCYQSNQNMNAQNRHQTDFADRHRSKSMPRASSNSLRPVYIDGPNVAVHHGNMKEFSLEGLRLALDYFLTRGHKDVIIFLPRYFHTYAFVQLSKWERLGYLKFTPSRLIEGKLCTPYDDKLMLQLAKQTGAVVISNDKFRDVGRDAPDLLEVINSRVVPYIIVPNSFVLPDDPYGRKGPNLYQILRF